MLNSLRGNRRAQRFFSAHVQSAFGNQLGYVGLVVLAAGQSDSALLLTAVLSCELLPALLLAPAFGAVADLRGRRRICVVAELARAAALAMVLLGGGAPMLIAIALAAGVGAAAFAPASLAALPALLEPDRRVGGLALHGFIDSIAAVAGPLLAGALLLVVSAEALLAIDSATFLISAALLMSIPARDWGVAPASTQKRPRAARITELPRPARMSVLAGAGVALFAGMVGVAEVLLATKVFAAGGGAIGLLIAAWGVGFAAAYTRIGSAADVAALWRLFAGGAGLLGVALIGAAASPTLAFAVAMFLFAGAGNGLAAGAARVIVQESVGAGRLSAAYGLKDSFDAGAVALSLLIGGVIAGAAGARAALAVAAAGCLICAALTAGSLGATRSSMPARL
jgi:MFS family permease